MVAIKTEWRGVIEGNRYVMISGLRLYISSTQSSFFCERVIFWFSCHHEDERSSNDGFAKSKDKAPSTMILSFLFWTNALCIHYIDQNTPGDAGSCPSQWFSSISYTLQLPAGPHLSYSPCLSFYFPSSTHLADIESSIAGSSVTRDSTSF